MPKKVKQQEKPARRAHRRRAAPRKANSKGFISMISNPAGSFGGAGKAMMSVIPAVGAYGVTRAIAKGAPVLLFRPKPVQDEQQRVLEVQRVLQKRRKAAPVFSFLTLLGLYFLSKKWKKLEAHQKSIFIGSLVASVHTAVQCWMPKLGKLVGITTPPQLTQATPTAATRRPRGFVDPTFGYSDADLDEIEAEAETLYGRRRSQYDAVRGGPNPNFSPGVAPNEVYEQSAVPPVEQVPPGMTQAQQAVWETEAALSGADEDPEIAGLSGNPYAPNYRN